MLKFLTKLIELVIYLFQMDGAIVSTSQILELKSLFLKFCSIIVLIECIITLFKLCFCHLRWLYTTALNLTS
jgi:hypothetical protein